MAGVRSDTFRVSKLNPLNLANRDLVLGAVIEFRSPRRLMSSHLLGVLQAPSVLQVNRHTGCAPGVIPDGVRNPAFRARLRIAAQAL